MTSKGADRFQDSILGDVRHMRPDRPMPLQMKQAQVAMQRDRVEAALDIRCTPEAGVGDVRLKSSVDPAGVGATIATGPMPMRHTAIPAGHVVDLSALWLVRIRSNR